MYSPKRRFRLFRDPAFTGGGEPIYSISESTTSVDEGNAVVFTVTTTNVEDGTTLYWTIDGTAVAGDFTDGEVSGSFTITSGSGSVTRTIKSDVSTEGTETFTLSVRTDSIAGSIVATSNTITINDTSVAVLYTWTEQSSASTQPYGKLTVTSDFTTQISTRQSELSGAQGPYISTDSGATWTRKVTGITFLTSGSSYTNDVTVARTDGTIMYIAQRRGFVSTLASTYDKIYKTTDTGDNWTATAAPDSTWASITCSADGTIVLAGNSNSSNATFDRKWAISTDGGDTWSAGPTIGQWTDVAMSSDGSRMYAVTVSGSNLYRSSNTGSTWTTTGVGATITTVACSDDGLTVIIGRSSSTPSISTDGGVTFTAASSLPTGTWRASVSGDGSVFAAHLTSASQQLYISTDGGTTWSQQTTMLSTTWSSSAIDVDGTNIIAGPSSGKPYVGTAP